MIFLVLFGIIALIVIALNIYDNSNLEKIKEHFEASSCQNIIYSKGTYKGICKDEIIQVDNSFSVDVKNDERKFKLNKINKIDKNNLTIIINNDYTIEFKDKENLEAFYKSLEEKHNK
ncbi:hypothetical protein [Arcobacter sp. LA11]|uniref:hypothetical protein n=1 Tax=Arcobacter sp. LA11 TaxID=1898176 RepID=UPI000933EA09|nr:hypothetical protein [Arcobacter sp. LA11]